jgi:hypothetical protein
MNDYHVEQLARMMLDQYGAGAVDRSLEQAETAEAIGDAASAKKWHDIADAVKRLQAP